MSRTPMSINSNAIGRALRISAVALSVSTGAYAAESLPPPAKSDAATAKPAMTPARRAGWQLAQDLANATTPEARQAALHALVAAAENSDAGAAYALGDIFLKGNGVAADPAKGRAYLEQAVADGHGGAPVRLGAALLAGKELPADPEAGLALLDKAAQSGNTGAMVALGDYYLGGGDPAKGRQYLEQAIAAGSMPAAVRLGTALVRGRELPRDTEAGVNLLKKASEHRSIDAYRRLAELSVMGGALPVDGNEAISYLEQSANLGATDAWRRIGEMYRDGKGVPKSRRLAVQYLNKAVESGDTAALVSLGATYLDSSGGPRDAGKALTYFREAEKKGSQSAVAYISGLTLSGEGTSRSPKAAINMLEASANDGNSTAARQLISLYRDGRKGAIPATEKRARQYLDQYRSLFSANDAAYESALIDAAFSGGRKGYSQVAAHYETLPPGMRERFLRSLRSAQPNAFVYVIQDRLKAAGYYGGPLNGALGTSTMSAIAKFCSERNIGDACRMGPLSGAAVQAIASELP